MQTNNQVDAATMDAGQMTQAKIDAGEWFPARDPQHGEFMLTADGVFNRRMVDGELKVRKICEYLRVTGLCHDENYGGAGLIIEYANKYNAQGARLKKQIPLTLTLSASALHSALEGDSLRILIDPPRNGLSLLNHYLRSFPEAGLPQIVSVSMGGWLDDEKHPYSTFVLRGECLRGQHGKSAILDEREGEGFRLTPRGTLQGWQETIAERAVFSRRVMFALCASLAAPLLPLLGGSSVMYHFLAESGTGKSTALYAAGSIWGRARDVRSVWDKTKNNLETKAIQFNNLPMIVDELKQMDRRTADAIAYAFGNGVERGRNIRGGKAAITREWLTLGLSAGEVTLNEVREGKGIATGEGVRFIHIPALADDARPENGLFEDFPAEIKEYEASQGAADDESNLQARREWLDGFKDEANAGAAGLAWLTKLLERFDRYPDGARGFIREARADIREYCNNPRWNKLTKNQWRVFSGFALIAYAGRLAVELGVLPWTASAVDEAIETCFNAWRDSDQTGEAQRENFVRSLENDPQIMGASYAKYNRQGERQNEALERPLADGLTGSLILETAAGSRVLAQIYTAQQFGRIVSRLGSQLSLRECRSELMKRGQLFGSEKTGAPYHPHKKARPHFGMIGGNSYYVVVPETENMRYALEDLECCLSAARRGQSNTDML